MAAETQTYKQQRQRKQNTTQH